MIQDRFTPCKWCDGITPYNLIFQPIQLDMSFKVVGNSSQAQIHPLRVILIPYCTKFFSRLQNAIPSLSSISSRAIEPNSHSPRICIGLISAFMARQSTVAGYSDGLEIQSHSSNSHRFSH
ncbi:hypothetical protein AVEN_86276-1 [Araneus ventricosus]|uniref:Uncharacterized protein n=1 Tax=Araneus ventricosus TaxID=182803 RepID=A0A4Y2WBJ1_ARAVE|nr:hypothetical protein AVEN_119732-1 [Araneus ventricosus]GBO34579.1 hypothetical protein AVEN_86276-1 [Araneus ventricosus]